MSTNACRVRPGAPAPPAGRCSGPEVPAPGACGAPGLRPAGVAAARRCSLRVLPAPPLPGEAFNSESRTRNHPQGRGGSREQAGPPSWREKAERSLHTWGERRFRGDQGGGKDSLCTAWLHFGWSRKQRASGCGRLVPHLSGGAPTEAREGASKHLQKPLVASAVGTELVSPCRSQRQRGSS